MLEIQKIARNFDTFFGFFLPWRLVQDTGLVEKDWLFLVVSCEQALFVHGHEQLWQRCWHHFPKFVGDAIGSTYVYNFWRCFRKVKGSMHKERWLRKGSNDILYNGKKEELNSTGEMVSRVMLKQRYGKVMKKLSNLNKRGEPRFQAHILCPKKPNFSNLFWFLELKIYSTITLFHEAHTAENSRKSCTGMKKNDFSTRQIGWRALQFNNLKFVYLEWYTHFSKLSIYQLGFFPHQRSVQLFVLFLNVIRTLGYQGNRFIFVIESPAKQPQPIVVSWLDEIVNLCKIFAL